MRKELAALWMTLALHGLTLPGCDTASSDFASFTESFSPTTPAEATQWILDPYDAENERRGTVAISNGVYGGDPPYLKLYRIYIEDNKNPLVRSAALEALGRHGAASDAELVAKQLRDRSVQVRMSAAKALQRLHNPSVTALMCSRMIDEGEDAGVRIELAIGLAQYPSDDVFQALAATLDARELGVNLAALDSLQLLTGQDFGIDRPLWLSWYRSTRTPFRGQMQYLYPTYQREKGFWDTIIFWQPLVFERPGVPAGMTEPTGPAPKQPFGNLGDGKAPEAKGP